MLIVGSFIPIEFADNNYEFIYDSLRFYGFPIAIMLSLTGTIKKKDESGQIAVKVFLTFCVSAFSVFIMFMTLFSGMCDWTTNKVFFENKQNTSIKIVQRDFGCGATDSSPATIKLFKIKEITPLLIWVTDIDTNQINKSEWSRIQNLKP